MNPLKRKTYLLRSLAILLTLALFALYHFLRQPTLNKPESVAYDVQAKRFLITNSGNGQIISQDGAGRFKVFARHLSTPRGIKILPPLAYVADGSQIRVLDLQTGALKASLPVPGAKLLNDIESDRDNLLYITDTIANKLFLLDPATRKIQSYQSPLLESPNGLVYDYPRKQMLIVCFRDASPLLSFDVEKKTFSVFKETLYDQLDGIAIDDLGRIYFSSWGDQSLLMIPQEQNRTLLWQKDLRSPADIFYHQLTNEIIVPLLEKNELRRFRAE